MSYYGSGGAQGRLAAPGDKVQLSGEELTALRRNVEEQEVLIKGYQQENEAAMQRIKVMKSSPIFYDPYMPKKDAQSKVSF
jgi:hypothetical protein